MTSSPRTWVVTGLGSLGIVMLLLSSLSLINGPKTEGASAKPIEASVLTPRRLPEVMSDAANDQALRALVNQTLVSSGVDLTRVSMSIDQDARDIVSRSSSSSVIPASSMKLLTAAAALRINGKDATFTTRVTGGEVSNGNLSGDLYLVGGGDPLLFTADYSQSQGDAGAVHSSLEALADAVVASGVRRVSGSVVGDDTRFDNVRQIPTWSPTYAIQGQVGPMSGLQVDQGFAAYDGGKVPSATPTLLAAQKFDALLEARGVTISRDPETGEAPEDSDEIATLASPTVAQIVAQMLTFSDNTTAEMMLKNIGVADSGSGTTDAGIRAVTKFLEDAGMNSEDYVAKDGSGLDRNDRLSCNLLESVIRNPAVSGPLRDGMPKAGATGTLAGRMGNTPSVGRVQAKTGSLNNVSALVGWSSPQENNNYSFCMITNDVAGERGRILEDQVATAIAGFEPPTSAETFAP